MVYATVFLIGYGGFFIDTWTKDIAEGLLLSNLISGCAIAICKQFVEITKVLLCGLFSYENFKNDVLCTFFPADFGDEALASVREPDSTLLARTSSTYIQNLFSSQKVTFSVGSFV